MSLKKTTTTAKDARELVDEWWVEWMDSLGPDSLHETSAKKLAERIEHFAQARAETIKCAGYDYNVARAKTAEAKYNELLVMTDQLMEKLIEPSPGAESAEAIAAQSTGDTVLMALIHASDTIHLEIKGVSEAKKWVDTALREYKALIASRPEPSAAKDARNLVYILEDIRFKHTSKSDKLFINYSEEQAYISQAAAEIERFAQKRCALLTPQDWIDRAEVAEAERDKAIADFVESQVAAKQWHEAYDRALYDVATAKAVTSQSKRRPQHNLGSSSSVN